LALTLNSYLKNNVNGIGGMFLRTMNVAQGSSGTPYGILKLFPTSVPYPNAPIQTNAAIPTGFLASIAFGSGKFTANSSNLIINVSSLSTTSATLAGTFGWWTLENFGANTSAMVPAIFASDSIGLNGTANIITVSTMTPTAGQLVSINFTLKVM
jgi:hypothetical protein